jgi:hypothetical protein
MFKKKTYAIKRYHTQSNRLIFAAAIDLNDGGQSWRQEDIPTHVGPMYLFGDYPFTCKLPYTWPRSMEQIPFDFDNLPTTGCDAPLFPYGYGLDTDSPGSIDWRDCPPSVK